MEVISNLVARSIVTNIQYVMIGQSHFVIEFTHDFMVYFTSHPGILGSIPVHRHVLHLLFCTSFAGNRGFRFAYD